MSMNKCMTVYILCVCAGDQYKVRTRWSWGQGGGVQSCVSTAAVSDEKDPRLCRLSI